MNAPCIGHEHANSRANCKSINNTIYWQSLAIGTQTTNKQSGNTVTMNNKAQGGILRSKKAKSTSNGAGHVSFSSNVQTSTFQQSNESDDDEMIDAHNRSTNMQNDNEYDSDDDDAILASGDGLAITSRNALHEEEEEDIDDAIHTKNEIEAAKKRRDDARHQTSSFERASNDKNLSLITDSDANPDEYQSNAGSNASCPVEPFNMNAEEDGGMGYFDGDTYIFRKKNVEGEEDAWLDGVDEENEEEEGGGGGLDSMKIWKPSIATGGADGKRRTSKYVKDGESQENMGSRLVQLLENDESAMMALTRHGSKLRQLQSQEQKLAKKNGIKKRKAKPVDAESEKDEALEQLKQQIKQIRETVEELTELADALLFEGETDAYDLKREDWIHRFELDGGAKRPAETVDKQVTKKPRHDYFSNDTAPAATTSDTLTLQTNNTKTQNEVTWEYKGNEDGIIHGPYTTRQMLEWTSCGYFIGASAVDIRQVAKNEAKTDADDLMADLMDDEDEKEETTGNEWMRSDAVDFNAYL